jgi:Amt family ammonium transporter
VTFQMTFAIITPALIVGAFAERMKFSALLVFMALWFTLVYAPIAHMVWSGDGGLMWDWGVLDFAGGTVVHINAGVAGLVACLVLGKRNGYPNTPMAPHNLGYTLIGASLLWVGWFGFNAGSAVARTAPPAWPCWSPRSRRRRPHSAGCRWNGCCTRSRACSASPPARSPVWSRSRRPPALRPDRRTGDRPDRGRVLLLHRHPPIKRKLGYDDSLDVFGVHAVGGIIGAILTGVFAAPALGGFGTSHRHRHGQLWIQFKGVAVTWIYTTVRDLADPETGRSRHRSARRRSRTKPRGSISPCTTNAATTSKRSAHT